VDKGGGHHSADPLKLAHRQISRVEDIVSFRFERPKSYEYRAGQWFVVTFSGPTEPYTHHFSHSNSPLEPELESTTRLRTREKPQVYATGPA